MWKAQNEHVRRGLLTLALSAGAGAIWVSGCAEAEVSYGDGEGGGTGGAMATGGVADETGGRSPSTGGSATGGAPATGGSSAHGGTATGGLSASGGKSPTGGAPATGGKAASTGGRSATGGAPATGGAVSSTGGVAPTGGVAATGGNMATGGTPSSGGPPDNVLMSYGFEQSQPDGWRSRGGATLTVSDEETHSGSFSLKVTGRTAGWHGAEYDVASLVTAGDTYDVTVWAHLTAGTASTTLMLTREVQGCTAEQFFWLDSAENVTDADWVELSGTLTLPAGCVPSKLVVYVESSSATASYYLDDTSMLAR